MSFFFLFSFFATAFLVLNGIGLFLIYKKLDHSALQLLMERIHEKSERTLKSEINAIREESTTSLLRFNELVRNTLQDTSKHQLERLNLIFQNQDSLLKSVENQLQYLRNENIIQLEKMRHTVDEKLQSTLEQRLSSSFKQVGERLDAVNMGIGEMQKMASDVGSLQRVLTNVKNRGVLGEVQLDRILSDVLTPEQYEKNVKTKKETNSYVEYAVKLPQKNDENTPLWLPIDAKFPTEDYGRLLDAYEHNDATSIALHAKNLEQKIKAFAKDIKDKYIDPPHTTDFAILFVPTEGLYSEILRMHGLTETLRRELSIVITGPSTIAALLNSLQMGFRTLTVEKRSTEIAKLLGAVKTDFTKFGDLLEKTQKKLDEASKQIGDASHRSKQISRKLIRVESMPIEESRQLLELHEEYE